MNFLEASHISLIQEYICKLSGQELAEILREQNLNVKRGRIEQWNEIPNFANFEDIFLDQAKLILIDTEDLEPYLGLEDIFESITSQDNIFFWSSAEKLWTADQRKIWTSAGGEYTKLVVNKDVFKILVDDYLEKASFKLSSYQTEKLINTCSNYLEVIDKLDILSVGQDIESILKWFEPEASIELFRLPLRGNNLKQDTKLWANSVAADDTQFALSIVWGKAEKLGRKDILKLIIQTDLDIKTRSKIPPELQFKKLMFDIGNL